MHFGSVALGPLRTNCYWLLDDANRTALVIDPGMDPAPVLAAIEGYQVQAIILTHGHFDHIMGVKEVKEATSAPVWISAIEKGWLTDPMLNRSGFRQDILSRVCDGPAPDRLLQEGETFSFGSHSFRTVHTPGHSPGSLSFITDGLALVGDVLFRSSVGRTDLPGGSMGQLVEAIHTKLFALPDETRVLPGHGPMTTIGREKAHNPFVGQSGSIVPWSGPPTR